MPDDQNLPIPVTAPVTSELPPGWTVPKALELIDALSRELYDPPYILKQYALTEDEFSILTANEWFKAAVEAQRAQWRKAENVHTRLAIETALVLEKNLPALSKRMGASTEPLAAVATLAKLFAEIAGQIGTGANKASDAPREKFKIVFNLGADVQSFDKSRPLVQITTDGPDGTQPHIPPTPQELG